MEEAGKRTIFAQKIVTGIEETLQLENLIALTSGFYCTTK